MEKRRSILEILDESLQDKCDRSTGYVRFKLIIDPNEDDSMISFLFKYGILKKERTKQFICSKLFGERQKVWLYDGHVFSRKCHILNTKLSYPIIKNQGYLELYGFYSFDLNYNSAGFRRS